MSIDFKELARPFDFEDHSWLVLQSDKKGEKIWVEIAAYVNARAVMQRLDDVCGPDNWWDEYEEGPSGGVKCSLTIRTAKGPVTKCDGAENTQFESVKGGYSDALKRAAVKFGIGRYLYHLPRLFGDVKTERKPEYLRHKMKDKSIVWFVPSAKARAAIKAASEGKA